MIHATYATTANRNTKRDAAENLIAFWEEKDISIKNDGYIDAFLVLGFIIGGILAYPPLKTFIHLGMGGIFIFMIGSYWLRRKSGKTNTPIENPLKNGGYMVALLTLGLVAGVIWVDPPISSYIHHGMVVILILMSVSYLLRRESDKTNTSIEDPIEHLRLQKEKMITRRSKNLKSLYIGIPLILLASLSNYYFFNPGVAMLEIVFSTGIILLIRVSGIIVNRTLYAQPLEDADKILSMED